MCAGSAYCCSLGWGIFHLRRPLLEWYRANPNYLRNPKFCVGCFEFYLSKILRQHLKQEEKYFFALFFCGTHFCGAY